MNPGLIVALDVPTAKAAQAVVQQLGEAVTHYKVGKALFTAVGPTLVTELVDAGKQVFLDLKYHDIPNTVGDAVQNAAALNVSMLTVHASGGARMLRAAAEAAIQSIAKPIVLGVTVLTSLDEMELQRLGVFEGVSPHVNRLASVALEAGCGGIVASVREAKLLRSFHGKDFTLVTPGIRLDGLGAQDQVRVSTPEDAAEAGADFIVVGRPIIADADPSGVARSITQRLGRSKVA